MSRRIPTKIRVMITDDHPVVREGISAMLSREKDIEVVGEAAEKSRDGSRRLERNRIWRAVAWLVFAVFIAVGVISVAKFGKSLMVNQILDYTRGVDVVFSMIGVFASIIGLHEYGHLRAARMINLPARTIRTKYAFAVQPEGLACLRASWDGKRLLPIERWY